MRVRRRTPITILFSLLLVAQAFILAGADAPAAIAQTASGEDLAKAAIVFAGDPGGGDVGSELYTIDRFGGSLHRLTRNGYADMEPVWSPDGRRIAFTSLGEGGFDMYAMDPDGTDRVQLSHTPGLLEEDPAWSPDGARIAFSGLQPGKSWHVFMMPADGSGHHRVVDAFSLEPTWYPDGTKLVFYACDADCGLYRIRTGGGGFRPWGLQRSVSGSQPDFRAAIPG